MVQEECGASVVHKAASDPTLPVEVGKMSNSHSSNVVPLVGIEPTHLVPETSALSTELQGRNKVILVSSQSPFADPPHHRNSGPG